MKKVRNFLIICNRDVKKIKTARVMYMSNPKIFAVDDSATIRAFIYDIFKDIYDIELAKGGTDFIERLDAVKPDLILMDIMMPDITGYELARALKKEEKYRNIPIIFLTSESEPESIVKGFEAGAVDYIIKPFNGHELKARVKTHLDLKLSKELLQEKNEALQEANATKDTFFSLIAHDLRGPFSALIGISKLLIDDFETIETAQMKKFLQVIHESTNSTLSLLENLLQWAKAQTGSIIYEPIKIDLYIIISMVLDLYKKNAVEKSITFKNSVEKETFVTADINMLQTIVRNLISNSLKYTPAGGQIEVRGSVKKRLFEVIIQDNGQGISEQNLEKLFRIDKHITTPGLNNEKGTGLGLILCKNFVEINKGTIWIESEWEKGCSVYFTLPYSQE